MESWIADLLVQAVAGAAGGVGAGSVAKDLSMGKPADALTGAVGGGIVGQILASALGAGDVAGMDVGTLVRDIVADRRAPQCHDEALGGRNPRQH